MLETVTGDDRCPHVFQPGTAERARLEQARDPDNPVGARCAWCHHWVQLTPPTRPGRRDRL